MGYGQFMCHQTLFELLPSDMSGTGRWTLDTRHWTLDTGHWSLMPALTEMAVSYTRTLISSFSMISVV